MDADYLRCTREGIGGSDHEKVDFGYWYLYLDHG